MSDTPVHVQSQVHEAEETSKCGVCEHLRKNMIEPYPSILDTIGVAERGADRLKELASVCNNQLPLIEAQRILDLVVFCKRVCCHLDVNMTAGRVDL